MTDTEPTPSAPVADLDAMLAAKVQAMKNIQAEAKKAQDFLAQCEQEALRLDGQMRLLLDMGARHPEIVPPPPVGEQHQETESPAA